jgi:O-antigen ligase
VSAQVATIAFRPASRGGSRIIAAIIVALALLAGLAAGDRSLEWTVPLAVIGGGIVLYLGARWPFTGLLVMLATSILLVAVRAVGNRSINAIDVLLMPVFLVSLFGRARSEASAQARFGPGHDDIHVAERRFIQAVVVFHGLALLSLVQLAVFVGPHAALDSALLLLRAVQALMFYPLCRWWLDRSDRIDMAWRAVIVGGAALATTSVIGLVAWDVRRPGMTFYLNDPLAPLASPNEAGANALFVAVVLLVRQSMRPDWKNLVLMAVMAVVLALTQSRSALLAACVFVLLTSRWVRPRHLLIGVLASASILPLLPVSFWQRMGKSLVVERGSFEAMSWLQRVYGWRTAWKVFLDHPWTGIGYLGFRFVSPEYNELRLRLVTVENYFYEILVSMGLVGLVAIAIVVMRLFRLGREIGRAAPEGTLASHMARIHGPLVFALLVANLTGDNFLGLVSLAQLALWCAVLVSAGHVAVAAER